MQERIYDVTIIGSGIGGSTLAAVLARHGLDILLMEGGSHPRFAIGESTIPESTLILRVLARRFDVPELAHLSTYAGTRKHISAGCGVKRNFSFFQHTPHEPVDPQHSTQFPTFAPPLGPDIHFFRQDVDAWLYHLALRYGANSVTNAKVVDLDIGKDHIDLHTADGRLHRTRFVVDAGGIRAILPQVLGLRESPCRYQTQSRSIFTHMVGVSPWERIAGGRSAHRLPSPPSQGTLHHLFDGGWAWVIPFDNHPRSTNHLCSVGVNVDTTKFPVSDESPEDEFWRLVSLLPSFAQQLRQARPVRGFMGSQRNQFSSSRLAGDRWCLLPHASNFIDPLFSSGLSVTFWAINQLAPRILHSVRTNQFSAEIFDPVTEWTERCFGYYDTLVSRSYKAFRSFEVWNAWNRVWVLASLYGNSGLIRHLSRAKGGLDDPAWEALETEPYRGVQAMDLAEQAALLKAASTEIDRFADGDQSASDTAGHIFRHIEASGLKPGPIQLLDPRKRAPANAFTVLPMTRLLAWGRRAPQHVRGRYFTSGAGLVTGLLAANVQSELGQGIGGVRHLVRDTFATWNRDWKRHGGSILAETAGSPNHETKERTSA
jgi:FADH2 O2-dependent halogenase